MSVKLRKELEALSKEELIERAIADRQQRLKQQRRLLTVGLTLALLIVALFSARALSRWRDRPTFEPIQPWMSIPHIARAYDVPPHILAEALELEPQPRDRRPLNAIAAEQDRDVDLLIALLNDAIRKNQPPDRPQPPTPPGSDDRDTEGAVTPTTVPRASD